MINSNIADKNQEQTNIKNSNKKNWQQIIKKQSNQSQQTPLILKQQSFKSQNQRQQYLHQRSLISSTFLTGREFLLKNDYISSSKQLSKTLMAFQFVMKNHMSILKKQEIRQIMKDNIIPAYNNLALCYLKMGNFQMVEKFTTQVLGQNPDNIKARYRRALALKQMKRFDESIKDFEIVKDMDSQMFEDCSDKIKQCRILQKEQKIKRKQMAKKFISGYKHQGTKSQNQETKSSTFSVQSPFDEPVNKSTQKLKNSNVQNNFGNNLFHKSIKCLKQSCKKISQIISSYKLKNKDS